MKNITLYPLTYNKSHRFDWLGTHLCGRKNNEEKYKQQTTNAAGIFSRFCGDSTRDAKTHITQSKNSHLLIESQYAQVLLSSDFVSVERTKSSWKHRNTAKIITTDFPICLLQT